MNNSTNQKTQRYYKSFNNIKTIPTNPGNSNELKWKKELDKKTGMWNGRVIGTHNRYKEIQEHNDGISLKSMLLKIANGTITELGKEKEYGDNIFMDKSTVQVLETIKTMKATSQAIKNVKIKEVKEVKEETGETNE